MIQELDCPTICCDLQSAHEDITNDTRSHHVVKGLRGALWALEASEGCAGPLGRASGAMVVMGRG